MGLLSDKKYKGIVTGMVMFLVVLFAGQIASNSLFYHTHSVDGKTYSHSHAGNTNGHTHSKYELNFYQQMQLLSLDELPVLLTTLFASDIAAYICEYNSGYIDLFISNSSGRAPPL